MIKFKVFDHNLKSFQEVNLLDLNENQPTRCPLAWPEHVSASFEYTIIIKWANYNNINYSDVYLSDGRTLDMIGEPDSFLGLSSSEFRMIFKYRPAKYEAHVICVHSTKEGAEAWVKTNSDLIKSDQIDYYTSVYYFEIKTV